MSPYLYRRLMREKIARLGQHAGASLRHMHGAHSGVAARGQPGPGTRALGAVERDPVVTAPATYRQLDQRTADGLAVTLEWHPVTDALRIVVVDRASEAVTF